MQQPSKPIDKFALPHWMGLQDYLTRLAADNKESLPTLAALGKYFNRDISWLHFNDRVLNEATAEDVPLLERLRYIGIVSSNLDEFFMVRVAEVGRMARQHVRFRQGERLRPRQLLSLIRDHVIDQKNRQATVFKDLVTQLSREGIHILTDFPEDKNLDKEIRSRLPAIKLIIRRSNEPLPLLTSENIHVFVRFPEGYAILTTDHRPDRLLKLPSSSGTLRMALMERWLCARAKEIFSNRHVIEAFPFKIIRDADLRYHPDDEETLEEQIVQAVERRVKAKIVRLEVDAGAYSDGAMFLATSLGLDSASLYRFDMPLDIRTLATIASIDSHPLLKYPPVNPQTPPSFVSSQNIFDRIKTRDYLLHHPYDSFEVIMRFLKESANDPHVTKIFHTLYRTSHESPIIEALKEGAKKGKKVTAYIEIKARFDEINNVRWAKELRAAGVKVVRPLGGFKVHSKLTQVIRQENDKEVSYLHLGTGNYHPGTARQYTDLGLLTDDAALGADVSLFFSALEKREKPSGFKELLVSPVNLHEQFKKLVRAEMDIQRQGGKGHLIAKMNALVDPDIINTLYEASQAGVKVDLLVRGICCLRPGVKGLSENIRVTSVVDRYLEHSRIYYFRAGGAKLIYLSSADWMPRNFFSRFETAFPIKDPALKKFIRDVVLGISLSDNTKAWTLKSDGSYNRVTPSANAKTVRSQFVFEALAHSQYKDTLLADRPKKN
jgi:polyphosphate kinase